MRKDSTPADPDQHQPHPSCAEKAGGDPYHATIQHNTTLSRAQKQHQRYIESLETPTLAQIERIARVQESKERDVEQRRSAEVERQTREAAAAAAAAVRAVKLMPQESEEREKAAGAIQRIYRGHRTRREIEGLRLSPTTRWVEVSL